MQGCGIASHLLDVLERIAKENEFTTFSATVLRENTAMIHVFKKRYPHAETNISGGGEILIVMNFDPKVTKGKGTERTAAAGREDP
jgi:ribosomal protein S18 acetylase RimI-like enzyme